MGLKLSFAEKATRGIIIYMSRNSPDRATESINASLSYNVLPNRRQFFKASACVALSYVSLDVAFRGPDLKVPLVPKDSLDFLQSLLKKFGVQTIFCEAYEAANESLSSEKVDFHADLNPQKVIEEPETRSQIIAGSFVNSSIFAMQFPWYIARYQQDAENADEKTLDCNDDSLAAGDFCKEMGVVSYHISVSPRNWSDFFRTPSHQFHAVKLAEDLYIFIDNRNCGGPNVTAWHGSLKSFIANYRIDNKPVDLITGIGITKHTSHKGVVKRISTHFLDSVKSEEEMEVNNLEFNAESSEFIQLHR